MSKQKYLRATMPDGIKWDVLAEIIARNHVDWWVKQRFLPASGAAHEREVAGMLDDDDIGLIDWAANEMNWNDVASYAKQVTPPAVDYQDGWVSGAKEVIEK